MAKGKDLLGRTGAAGLGGSLTPQSKPVPTTVDDPKDHGGKQPKNMGAHQKNSGPGGGQSQTGGGGKAPVGQRPKV